MIYLYINHIIAYLIVYRCITSYFLGVYTYMSLGLTKIISSLFPDEFSVAYYGGVSVE